MKTAVLSGHCRSVARTSTYLAALVHRTVCRLLSAMLTDGTGKAPEQVWAKAELKSDASNVS